MIVINWFSGNYIEVFGAATGIIFVFLEIRQNLWLWPVGIITSAVYIWVFFDGKLYADMSLQVYYLVISILGWLWWIKGPELSAQDSEQEREKGRRRDSEIPSPNSPFEGIPIAIGKGDVGNKGKVLNVTHIKKKVIFILTLVFVVLYTGMWLILHHLTDSPVPEWDAFITSMSIIATWMLARKIFEHWYLWIVVNSVAVVLFLTRGLYPTVALYTVYCIMSFIGLKEWKKTLPHPPDTSPRGEGE